MLWALGVEYYKNETEKEMEGAIILHFEIGDNVPADDVRELVSEFVMKIINNAKMTEQSDKFKSAMLSGLGKVDFPHALAFDVTRSVKGYSNIVRIVEHDTFWFHVFVKDEMARQRKSMFEKSVDELEGETKERSFEEIMGEDLNTSDTKSGNSLSFTADFYFSKSGSELNGLPDFWAVKAGLV